MLGKEGNIADSYHYNILIFVPFAFNGLIFMLYIWPKPLGSLIIIFAFIFLSLNIKLYKIAFLYLNFMISFFIP